MCVLLGPKVVINNAFFAKQNLNLSFMEMNALQDFCNILYDKITGNSEKGSRNKYVCFKVDDSDLDEFFDSDRDFIRGIDKIYKLRDIDINDLLAVNSIYDADVQASLEDARKAFSQMN